MKIKLVYGFIEHAEIKTERKTFKTPYFDPWKESPISFDVTMEERHELDKFLFEFNGYARPWQITWKVIEDQDSTVKETEQ